MNMNMSRLITNAVLTIVSACLVTLNASAQTGSGMPPRLRRADSYLGIHFDFHAGHDCTEIGKNVTPEMIQRVIDQVKPDYIQCDCKGHPGISSYPTKVGNPAPGFVRDQLRIWRDVTARNGVSLYMHYSGVWDNEAVSKHPEWARIDENGKRDDRLTSVFGGYTAGLVIPQFRELCDDYGVDGVWVDGECWATERDYGGRAAMLFSEKTGITVLPKAPGDPGWFEWTEFHRQGFRDHLREYTDAMHRHNPAFQVCSNWAYSSHMPEKVTVDVDFISGDFSARNSVNAGRFEGRCMVHQGRPWDLMAWSFTWSPGIYTTKTAVQLQREAATVISLGGGFQAYFPQNRDGSVRQWEWDMNLMGQVAEFCRARQEICHKAEPVPQVALIYSADAFYRGARKVFSAWHGEHDPLKGALQNLLDHRHSVEIVSEHHLRGRMSEYPLIVFPEWEYIDPAFKEELTAYVRDGGNLLVIGPKAAKLFERELGVTLEAEPQSRINGLVHRGVMAGLETLSQRAVPAAGTETFGTIYLNSRNDMSGPAMPAATIRTLGRGRIAATYLNLGERYLKARTAPAGLFLHDLARELFPEPMVEVYGAGGIDVILNTKNGKLAVNLVNTGGAHENDAIFVIDEIPPAGPQTVAVRMARRPSEVTIEPGARETHWNYADGRVLVSLPDVPIHEIVVIEP